MELSDNEIQAIKCWQDGGDCEGSCFDEDNPMCEACEELRRRLEG